MNKSLMRGILLGIPLGIVFVLILNWGLIPFLIVGVGVTLLASMMDWSGQGDGREGCNLHSSCNH